MKKVILTLSVCLVVLMAGCGGAKNAANMDEQATLDFQNAVETGLVQTIAAVVDATTTAAASVEATDEQPPDSVGPTATQTTASQATLSPTQPQAAFTPTPTELSTPCFLAELVEETIPDGTVFEVGDGFVKTWVVRNSGVCAWGEDFRWQLVSGHDLKGVTDVKIAREDVQPGDTITISIEMSAPITPGPYHSVYKIFTDEGGEVTPNGFWIDIEVVAP